MKFGIETKFNERNKAPPKPSNNNVYDVKIWQIIASFFTLLGLKTSEGLIPVVHRIKSWFHVLKPLFAHKPQFQREDQKQN